ncbi:hypothetical protein F66182_17847, partial [Fusarium sp. NRRL 66182]
MASEHQIQSPVLQSHALSITPSITERRGAKFGDDKIMTEPLSVVAVYSTTGYYVDVRAAKADDQNILDLATSNLNAPLSGDLEWAFAGKIELRLPDQQDTNAITQARA